MSVAIVLVDYNGLADTRRCLESLRSQPACIVVVDNASAQNVEAALKADFPDVQFVRSPTNGGWAGGNNLGLKHALDSGAEQVILLNNDTTVEPHFVDSLTQHRDCGILGPVIRYMGPPHEVQTEGVTFNKPSEPGFFQRVPVPLDGGIVDVDIVNGCCLMVHRDVIEKIGFIDEQFFLIHEEADFCLRAQEAGFKLGVLGESLVFHKGSSTFAREGQGIQRYYDARNLLRLLSKHRGRRGERSHFKSVLHAWRYTLSRYALEREQGYRASADAVLAGLYDGVMGRYGPRSDRWRPGFSVMRGLIETLRRIKRYIG